MCTEFREERMAIFSSLMPAKRRNERDDWSRHNFSGHGNRHGHGDHGGHGGHGHSGHGHGGGHGGGHGHGNY
jgi:hypothetical protein